MSSRSAATIVGERFDAAGLRVFAIALSLAGFSPDRAAAQSPSGPSAESCFEIIPPQRHAHPRSPLLFNKCSGETWLLVPSQAETAKGRRSRLIYRWVLLEVEGTRDSKAAKDEKRVTVAPQRAAGEAADGGKPHCFMFVGRQFCE
jgi:hypothetical protein